MAKYSYDFKKKLVSEIINDGNSIRYTAKKYNIRKERVSKWVRAYKTRGDAGLHRNKTKKVYSYEFKMRAVARYLESDLTHTELINEFNLSSRSIIYHWITEFRNSEVDYLQPKRRRRRPVVTEMKKDFKQVHSTNDNIYEEYQGLK